MKSNSHSRRTFLKRAAASASALGLPHVAWSAQKELLGQGDFQYRVVPNWGVLGESTPVANCHGIVTDREGHIILLTTEPSNHVIVYDQAGRLMHKWGTDFPGAHGLSIVQEGDREVLFITALQSHSVTKATLDGEILEKWEWPASTGKYEEASQYRPSWTLHLPNGDFFVLDGYGRDYVMRYRADGTLAKVFGGEEGGIAHWGPHGGMVDLRNPSDPELLIAMSDQQHLLRLSLDGAKLGQVDLPGGNPRQIRPSGNHFFMAHLADNWPADRNSRGFVSVLDADFRVVSNIGGTPPVYDDAGSLQPMQNTSDAFIHPHDLVVDDEGSLYVAQFASNNTYPVKLERV